MLDIDRLVAETLDRLRAKARLDLGAGAASLSGRPTSMKVYGVAAPDVHLISRELGRSLRDEAPRSVVDLALALSASGVYDARFVADELRARHRAAFATLRAPDIERLGRGMDNWASVDSFGRAVSGLAWRVGLLSDGRIARWARSKDLWWRRGALVSTVALNEAKTGDGDAARTLAICDLLVDDREGALLGAAFARRPRCGGRERLPRSPRCRVSHRACGARHGASSRPGARTSASGRFLRLADKHSWRRSPTTQSRRETIIFEHTFVCPSREAPRCPTPAPSPPMSKSARTPPTTVGAKRAPCSGARRSKPGS